MDYRFIAVGELTPELFSGFIRRQVVDKCVRREQGKWVIKSHPFVDDWTENDYAVLIAKLKRIMCGGGFVLAAFDGEVLKAFSAVDGNLFVGLFHFSIVALDLEGSGSYDPAQALEFFIGKNRRTA